MDTTVTQIGAVVVAELRAAGYMESTIAQYAKTFRVLPESASERVYSVGLGAEFASMTISPRTGRFSAQRRFDYYTVPSAEDPPIDGRVGSCFDNAASEAFFSTLEHEVLSRHRFATKAQARAVVTAWCHDFLQPTTPTQFGRLAATRRIRKDRGHPTGRRIKEASTIRGEAQSAI